MSGPHTILDPLGIGGGRHSLLDPAGIFGNRGSSGGDHLAGIEIQTSCYGGALPLVYGTTRVAGNLVDYDDFTTIANTQKQSGGISGGSVTSTTYTYTAGGILALCEGPVSTVVRVWQNGAENTMAYYGISLMTGARPQSAWGTWATKHPGKAVGYSGMALACNPAWGLGSAATLANYSFEVVALLATEPDTGSFITLGTGDGTKTQFYLLDANGNQISDSTTPPMKGYLNYTIYAGGTAIGTHHWSVYRLNTGVYVVSFDSPPSNGALVQWNIVATTVSDAMPGAIVVDFLTEPNHGAGWPSSRLHAQLTAPPYTGGAVAMAAWCNSNPTAFQTYCTAMGFAVSAAFDTQKAASSHLSDLLLATNAEAVWSAGQTSCVLNIIPYGDTAITGNGVTYAPNTSPLYALGYDDYIGALDATGHYAEDPVTVTRKAVSDIYNTIPVEWWDRMAAYNVSTVQENDPVDVALHGPKVGSSVSCHMITRRAHAQALSRILAQRSVYLRNQYKFRVSWKYMLLEPMDLITISDPKFGLVNQVVRIIDVTFPAKDSEDQGIEITAEAWPFGVGTPVVYQTQATSQATPNGTVDPGDAKPPTIFIVPPQFVGSGQQEIMIATAGGPQWGGCQVWASEDGVTYAWIGTMTGPSRYGVTLSTFGASGGGSVDLSISGGSLVSASTLQAKDHSTPLWINGEIVEYSAANLGGSSYQYTLTLPVRGDYGTTAVAHAAGEPVVRMDGGVFSYLIPPSQVNGTLYLKLVSFNLQGQGLQNIANVTAYEFLPNGGLYLGATVTNLAMVYSAGQLGLSWDPILNLPGVQYEVRFGPTWASAKILGRTPSTFFATVADGTYWVAAYYSQTYSVPATVTVAGTTLTQNIILAWDEAATSWSGTLGGSAALGGGVTLTGGNTTGTYTTPTGHIVNVGIAQACTVACSYAFVSSGNVLVSSWASVSGQDDIESLVVASAATSNVTMQISVDPGTGTFGAWQNFIPGQYVGSRFQMRASLLSALPTSIPTLTAMTWSVSLPDRVLRGTNVAILAAGTAITFSTAFQIVPNVQITIANAVAGDDIFFLAGPTASGFTVQVKNAGAGVARNINWIASAY